MSIQYFNIPVLQCDDTTPGLNFHELYDFWIPDVVSLPKQDNGGSLKLNESTKFLTVFEPWNPDTRVFQTWNPTPGMVPGLVPHLRLLRQWVGINSNLERVRIVSDSRPFFSCTDILYQSQNVKEWVTHFL